MYTRPTQDAYRLPDDELAAFWQQMLPSMPVLPVYPAHNHCIFNNLASDPYHGMEGVIGSIPIRSTNYFNNLADSPSNVWQQIGSKFQAGHSMVTSLRLIGSI
jgi:hypothetical protein